jgi:hypothetical protein
VLASFGALAGGLLILRAGGAQIGWGLPAPVAPRRHPPRLSLLRAGARASPASGWWAGG